MQIWVYSIWPFKGMRAIAISTVFDQRTLVHACDAIVLDTITQAPPLTRIALPAATQLQPTNKIAKPGKPLNAPCVGPLNSLTTLTFLVVGCCYRMRKVVHKARQAMGGEMHVAEDMRRVLRMLWCVLIAWSWANSCQGECRMQIWVCST